MYIYEVRNKVDGKHYIGQTSKEDPKKRWNEHRCYLRKGKHRNKHLQHAWNKHGEQNFEFNILKEYSSLSKLNKAERKIVKERGDYNIEPGGGVYPISQETRIKISRAKRKKPYPKVVGPDGKLHKIEPPLEEFCRKHGVWSSSFRAMLAGRINYANGWHLPHIKIDMSEAKSLAQTRTWKSNMVIGPDGKEYKVTNRRKFIRDHNLNVRHFTKVLQGKYQQHKGWHLK